MIEGFPSQVSQRLSNRLTNPNKPFESLFTNNSKLDVVKNLKEKGENKKNLAFNDQKARPANASFELSLSQPSL